MVGIVNPVGRRKGTVGIRAATPEAMPEITTARLPDITQITFRLPVMTQITFRLSVMTQITFRLRRRVTILITRLRVTSEHRFAEDTPTGLRHLLRTSSAMNARIRGAYANKAAETVEHRRA